MNRFEKEIKIYNQLLIILWSLIVLEVLLGLSLGVSQFIYFFSLGAFKLYQVIEILFIIYLVAKMILYIIYANKLEFENDYFPKYHARTARTILIAIIGVSLLAFIMGLFKFNTQALSFVQLVLFVLLLLGIRNGKLAVKIAEQFAQNNPDYEYESDK